MIKFAFSFISGIAAYNFFPFFPVSISVLCISIIASVFFTHCRDMKKIFIVILAFVFGFLYAYARHPDLPELTLPEHETTVEGTIVDVPGISEGKLRFTIDRIVLEGKEVQGRIRLVVLQKFFKDKITEGLFAPGDRIRALAKLKEPYMFQNPGVYSYDFKKDGIVAAGYIKQARFIGGSSGLPVWIHKKRRILGRIIDNSLSAENASFLKAIIPGLKRGISRDMRDAFSATGLAHLLSISGTHFGLLAFMVFISIRTVIKYLPIKLLSRMTLYITPTSIAIVITLPVLVFYALISGTGTPTVRSLIMVFIYMLALFLGRKGQWLNSLSIAAVIILLWNPEALFELSFQLSFIAVFSIGYVMEKRVENSAQNAELQSPLTKVGIKGGVTGIQRISEKVKTAILITIAAVLGTAPIVALVFKQFPLISPVTNLIITPLVCFVILPLGFVTGFGALLFNMSSMPLSGPVDVVTHFTLKLIKWFSNIPYASYHIPDPSFAIIALYFLSLIFLMKSKFKWRFLPLILVLCFYLFSPYLLNNSLRVTFLDVGQGDASVIELPDGKIMLIDGSTHEPDMGQRVIAPYLWSRGIRRVDYMVMSHPHPDHFGGLIYIMDNLDVGEIWFNGRRSDESLEFFQKMEEKDIPYRILARGDMLEAKGYKIYALHPYDEFYADSPRARFSNQNSASLVLKIENNDVSILFTGDIETEAEENLTRLGGRLKSDIIKVPHHGGRTSSLTGFIQTVSPQIAVISVGRNNPYNHPHQETLRRYEDEGVRVFRTDTSGAVTIISGGNTYEVKTYGDSRLKKVSVRQDEIRNLRLLL
ncbi:MAG TPA: DNA internalization-related competence protein ComEC/Rec2 [Nitrospirae bacterium]|nr:comEC family competence protein [bacterium BMS3Abin06]HDH13446.1 DNA internalization-related competence protein ComEC/Rec2 [Nitrospirota bacterium]HDZ01844.1 DNA internalization-related competence protein ComEC/Rec2 [Nitrospirota bacterium]